MTSSSDLQLRGQRSKKVKSQTSSNVKISTVSVFILVKHEKMYTVTSLYDQCLRGERSQIAEITKPTVKGLVTSERSNLTRSQLINVTLSSC